MSAALPLEFRAPITTSEMLSLMRQNDELFVALRDLLEQIDCLDDISYSRDIEPYKAEANWQDSYDRACAVLAKAQCSGDIG